MLFSGFIDISMDFESYIHNVNITLLQPFYIIIIEIVE